MKDEGILKVGLVGCGRVATLHHMPVYNQLETVRVVAVSDVHTKSCEALARSFRIGKCFQDAREMMSEEALDLVDICTPPATHYSLAMEAIGRGFNVLLEKPAALEFDDLIRLRDASNRAGTKVCVVHNYRFLPRVAELMCAIRDMRLGTIRGAMVLSHESFQRSEKDCDFLYETALHVIDLQSLIMGKYKTMRDIFTTRSPHTGRILGVSCLVEYERGPGIVDAGEGFGSDIVGIDVFGSKRDAALRFHPESLAFLQSSGVPLQVVRGVVAGLARFGLSRALSGRHYYASYHRDLISNYVRSILENSETPVTIDDVMNTMKVLQAIKIEALK